MFHVEQNSPHHLKTGKTGENIACRYLKKKGYRIIERNFRRKWGEIDLICSNNNEECSSWNKYFKNMTNVLHGTNGNKIIFVEVKTLKSGSNLNPEDNLTYFKQKKLIRTCQLYLAEKGIDPDVEWQIDAILIKIDPILRKAKIKHIESAIY